MLLVKTRLDKSTIAGVGLFANQDIQKGERIWQMRSISTFKITPSQYDNLSKLEQDFIQNTDYYWIDNDDNYMIPIDDARFINHSCDPNIVDLDENTCIASRDIKNGEELTADYRTLVPEENWKDYYSNQNS
jgi:SET domain-containing protein